MVAITVISSFISGLQFKNVLNILKDFPEGVNVLTRSEHADAEEVISFYNVQYSSGDEKSVEERVIYNFHRFLKNVESK